MTKHLLPDECVSLYHYLGIKPMTGEWITADGAYACAMGAVVKNLEPEFQIRPGTHTTLTHDVRTTLTAAGYSDLYQVGFEAGFDGRSWDRFTDEREGVEAYDDGIACRLACLKAFGSF